jgi:hypothetical protein
MATIAERLFDSHYASSELEESLEGKINFTGISWDWYDNSLEIHGSNPNDRLSLEVQKIVHAAGFSKVYVNHMDKWETHYSFVGDFKEQKGWRVSYPHKRGEGEKGIWVEEIVTYWPKEWFDTGYCIIK